jgi:hypothetical protein
MLKYFTDEITKTDFKIGIDEESYGTIKEHQEGLEDLVKDFDAVNRGVASTEAPKNIQFMITRDGWRTRDNTLGLNFLDISGGWLQEDSSSTNYQTYFKQVQNSGVIIIPIDTLALMEENGRFHQQLNDPQSVTKMIATVYETLPDNEERLVLFVPIKCETYVKSQKNMERLVKEVKKGYAELIDNILSPKSHQVAAVITPIETVGCVICGGADIDLDTGEWKGWLLNKTRVDALMESQWVDQPLRYILRFLIHQSIKKQKKGVLGKAFFAANDFLGANKDIYDALKSFSQGRITIPPFDIIQGHELLKID